jgi:hypothetical protein
LRQHDGLALLGALTVENGAIGGWMSVSFTEWRAAQRRKFDAELRELRRGTAPSARRPRRSWKRWIKRRGVRKTAVAAVALGCLVVGQEAWKPLPLGITLRHLLAARNCAAARSVGLAPAKVGEPGYWRRNDADNDGIACEPWSGRR